MNQFGCFLPNRVEFGAGKTAALTEWIKGRRILLLSDAGVKKSGLVDTIAASCRDVAAGVEEFYDIPTEPSEDEAAAVADRFRTATIDAIVAVGGGSVLDMAKILATLIGSDATVAGLFEGQFPAGRRVAVYMLPTTAGTGSEATPNAILYRPALKLKVGIVNGLFMADRVILDPELTLGLPPKVTASTGMDALCHAVECLVSNKANPMSDMMAVEATRLIFAHLRTAHRDGSNLEARSGMLLASFYAGVCIACSGTNIVHALSYPLGGRHRIAHGVSNAMLLAAGMRFNAGVAEAKLAELARFLPGGGAAATDRDKAGLVLEELAALTRDLGIPLKLAEVGVPASEIDTLVEDAYKVRRLLDQNPRVVEKEDIRKIYMTLV